MELLIAGVVGYFVVSIQEWIADRRRTQKELDRIKGSLGKVECVKHTLPTGEEQMLGPGKIYVFGGPKTGIITGTSLLRNEEFEEMGANLDEAERVIKEACDRTFN